MVSYKTRMEQIDADLTTLENAVPFVLTQVFPPNQKDWETAWVAAGNSLPIPTTQELYWYDGTQIRGEFKTLPDQWSMLARSLSTGFQIRDIAGWEDDDHLIVYVVRDDPLAPQRICRLYMDGTLEDMTTELGGGNFVGTGKLLGYDSVNSLLWYTDGSFRIRYVNTNTLVHTTVATAANANNLPETRFFVILPDGSGDVYYGALIGADPNRSLYYYDLSALSNTRVMTTFNPGTGAVNPDRPVAATASYVFLSEVDSRAAFDGNLVHQILRSGYTYDDTVDHGTYSSEVRVIVYDADYAADTIQVLTAHLTPSILFQDWNRLGVWDGAATTFNINQPHIELLRTLRTEINDHGLDYHVATRLYYDSSFVADGGDEEHYNNIGAFVTNPSGTKYLIHDLGWHTWTVSDAPDIWVYGDTTSKVYRVSGWEQFDDDVIIVATGFTNAAVDVIDLSTIPNDYQLLEFIHEAYTTTISNGYAVRDTLNHSGAASDKGGGSLISTNLLALTNQTTVGNTTEIPFSELTTNASLRHHFILRDVIVSGTNIRDLFRSSVRTAYNPGSGIATNIFIEGTVVSPDLLSLNTPGGATLIGNRWILRAWRTQPRMVQNGAEYDPGMA